MTDDFRIREIAAICVIAFNSKQQICLGLLKKSCVPPISQISLKTKPID
jgi:hypothetical protein